MQQTTFKVSRSVMMLFALLFLAFTTSASAGDAIPFTGNYTGVGQASAVDSDSDGANAVYISESGRTSHGGKFETVGTSELAAWDGSSFCSATEVLVQGGREASVFRYSDGSLLYTAATSMTMCFNFVDSTWTWNSDHDILGGTGRFDGASGSFNRSGTGQRVPGFGVSTFSGEISGTITLP